MSIKKDAVSLDEMLNDFSVDGAGGSVDSKPFTLWVPEDSKAKFDKLQKVTNRNFSKKLREMFIIAIDKAHEKIA